MDKGTKETHIRRYNDFFFPTAHWNRLWNLQQGNQQGRMHILFKEVSMKLGVILVHPYRSPFRAYAEAMD